MPSSSAAWALKYWPRVSAVPLGGREDVRLWQAGNLAFVLVALPFVRDATRRTGSICDVASWSRAPTRRRAEVCDADHCLIWALRHPEILSRAETREARASSRRPHSWTGPAWSNAIAASLAAPRLAPAHVRQFDLIRSRDRQKRFANLFFRRLAFFATFVAAAFALLFFAMLPSYE
jgi:hypothetical protein